MHTPSFRNENKLMGPEKQNSIASEETKNTKKNEVVIEDPGSNKRESSGSSSTANLADEVFTKIVTIFKKQSFGEAFKEGVDAFRKEATRFFRKGNNKGSLSGQEDQISVHMGPEGRLYSSKSTNGGKGLKNSKINSYFTP